MMNELYTNRTGRIWLAKLVHPGRVKRKRRVQAFTGSKHPSHTILQSDDSVDSCVRVCYVFFVLHAHVMCAYRLFEVGWRMGDAETGLVAGGDLELPSGNLTKSY